jgi:hypothetical protein
MAPVEKGRVAAVVGREAPARLRAAVAAADTRQPVEMVPALTRRAVKAEQNMDLYCSCRSLAVLVAVAAVVIRIIMAAAPGVVAGLS